MSRVLILNNYSVERVWNEINQGTKPSHHLYGICTLEKYGYNVSIIDPKPNSPWFKISKYLSRMPLLNFGNLQQQIEALVRYREYDFIYAPCQDTTIFLGLLAYFGLFGKPIIALAHHPFLRGKLKTIRKYTLYCSINGHFRFPSLSSEIADQLNCIAKREISTPLPWGPDLKFYADNYVAKSAITRKYDLVAIGRTGRDYLSFVKAFAHSNIRVCIFCNVALKTILDPFVTSNIEIKYLESDEALNYISILNIYATSRVIAIPLFKDDSLCGLTSITDAIGCQMPLIMNHNKYVDLNPVHYGIGQTVTYDSNNDWVIKANQVLESSTIHELNTQKAASCYNIELFTQKLVDLFKQL